jgi:hypothetical protein
VKDSEFVPNGYKIFRQDRDLNFYTRGIYTQTSRGGTLLLVKNYLNPTLIETNVQAELCWININPHPNVNIPCALKQRIYNGKNSTWFLITVLADSSLESPVSVSFSQFARFLSASLGRSHVF